MKYTTALILLLMHCCQIFSQVTNEELMQQLAATIEQAPRFDAQKQQHLLLIKQSLAAQSNSLPGQFDVYSRLYEEYKIFNYDSAYRYARLLQQTARQLNDSLRITYAKIRIGFTLLSAGMFKETLDTLSQVNMKNMPDSVKAEYYSLMGRFYFDLGDFDNDPYHTPVYVAKGSLYFDSALKYFPDGGFDNQYYIGLKNIKSGNRATAFTTFRQILNEQQLTDHQLALVASTLSDFYIQNGKTDSAINLLLRAAIADIRSSTKETSAIFNLAGLLYKKRDVKNASICINQAIADAVFYGARQRKVQVGSILPLIESEKLNLVENQKRVLITYATVVTLLFIIVIVLAVVIFRQVKKLKLAQKVISEAHHKEQAINHQLAEVNEKLSDANKIKEEYIGYFFNANAEFFNKIERFKKSLEQKIADRKLEEIRFIVNNIDLRKEKEDLLRNFDKAFLKLFPHFVTAFNALFKEEDKVTLKDDELLNTDLRIFALIRMGIHDSEKIAHILQYSVNTISTYKTKIKNKSLVPNEEFEEKIMNIKTV
ncbi:MAG: DUF6377 domain-containing protein [Chitinophagaceae bacterium]